MNLNPKLETLNSKQTQNFKSQDVLYFEFEVLDLFSI